jgi:RNA polymerase sigma-70 factor (family 1)
MNQSSLDDDFLLKQFREGDPLAYKRLFDKYYAGLCYYAKNLIDVTDEAEDIVADMLLKLWERRGQFHSLTNIQSFLYLITRNRCLDYIRQKGKMGHKHSNWQILQPVNEESLLQKCETLEIQTETIKKIDQAINDLPHKMRQVFQLSFLEGKSTVEIVHKLGISEKTVMNQKRNAQKFLRKRCTWVLLATLVLLTH